MADLLARQEVLDELSKALDHGLALLPTTAAHQKWKLVAEASFQAVLDAVFEPDGAQRPATPPPAYVATKNSATPDSATPDNANAGTPAGLAESRHAIAPSQAAAVRSHCQKPGTVVASRFVDSDVNPEGVRIISSGSISCGMDTSLYVVKLKFDEAEAHPPSRPRLPPQRPVLPPHRRQSPILLHPPCAAHPLPRIHPPHPVGARVGRPRREHHPDQHAFRRPGWLADC